MIPALEILAQAPAVSTSNWPTAVTVLAGIVVTGLLQWYSMKREADKTKLMIEATNRAVTANTEKVDNATYKVSKLGEVLNEQGQRIDGRLTELLSASIAKAHAEGVITGTKDEQLRVSVPAPVPGPTITPVQIVNPDPIEVTPVGARLEEIRGQGKGGDKE